MRNWRQVSLMYRLDKLCHLSVVTGRALAITETIKKICSAPTPAQALGYMNA